MAADDRPRETGTSDESKEEAGFKPLTAAALFGGAMAATAGAYFGTRALARKNREKDGRPINSVLATAITACDLAHEKGDGAAAQAPETSEPEA